MSYGNAIKVWELLFKLYHKITHGCEDSNPAAVEAHAAEAEQLGSELLSAYLQVANKKDVTVYIHVSAVHLGQMIRRHGSMGNWCSQGLEALHQWVHFFGRHRCNKQKQHAAASILRACTMRAFSARTKVITAKGAAMRARAMVRAAAKHAASGVARTKFTREHKSKHMVQKHVDAVKAMGPDKK
eukprot:jgi/Tetstr1/464953/TSEL_009687.t1